MAWISLGKGWGSNAPQSYWDYESGHGGIVLFQLLSQTLTGQKTQFGDQKYSRPSSCFPFGRPSIRVCIDEDWLLT